jgi:hypothetical protein
MYESFCFRPLMLLSSLLGRPLGLYVAGTLLVHLPVVVFAFLVLAASSIIFLALYKPWNVSRSRRDSHGGGGGLLPGAHNKVSGKFPTNQQWARIGINGLFHALVVLAAAKGLQVRAGVMIFSIQKCNSCPHIHVTRLYKIDKIVRRRNLNFRLRNISIHVWSMSQPELVRIAMETSAPKELYWRFQGTKSVFWNVETEFTMSVSHGDMDRYMDICCLVYWFACLPRRKHPALCLARQLVVHCYGGSIAVTATTASSIIGVDFDTRVQNTAIGITISFCQTNRIEYFIYHYACMRLELGQVCGTVRFLLLEPMHLCMAGVASMVLTQHERNKAGNRRSQHHSSGGIIASIVDRVGANGLMAIAVLFLLWPNPIASSTATTNTASGGVGVAALAPKLLAEGGHEVC